MINGCDRYKGYFGGKGKIIDNYLQNVHSSIDFWFDQKCAFRKRCFGESMEVVVNEGWRRK